MRLRRGRPWERTASRVQGRERDADTRSVAMERESVPQDGVWGGRDGEERGGWRVGLKEGWSWSWVGEERETLVRSTEWVGRVKSGDE